MLANLINQPGTPEEWAFWSYAHRDQHTQIIQAIRAQTGIQLPQYELDPIPFQDLDQWLEWNQRAHDDFNGVLGTQSSDLQQADFNDKAQLEAWIYLHRREHETAASVLKI